MESSATSFWRPNHQKHAGDRQRDDDTPSVRSI